MLYVERSNRTEALLEAMAERRSKPGSDPLRPARVVVQGPGMERWVAQSLALRHGVCANIEFLFPRALLDQLFDACPEGLVPPANPKWAPASLAWSIAARLAETREDPVFAPLERHLAAADGEWRTIQLAHRLAELIDRYVSYRPDWIAAWTRGESGPEAPDAAWQAVLVRHLVETLGPGHLGDRAAAFADLTANGQGEIERVLRRVFPEPVEVFAISTLPPLSLAVLSAAARVIDVQLSVLSPTRSYWADLWREVRDTELGDPAAVDLEPFFSPATTTPMARLLAGLGRLGADFQRLLEEVAEDRAGDDECYVSPAAESKPTILQRLQGELLDLEHASADGPVDPDDDSLRVHLCHGPRRELEVVEAELREAFDRDPSLRPEDVIVMAPRIDAIAPDIEAVFGDRAEPGTTIPHRIADRSAFQRSPVAEAFAELLELIGGRAPRSELLDWLARPVVRARFGLEEESVERIAEWAVRAGYRFGIDGAHRAALGLGRDGAHTLRDALERLALAHALGSTDEVFAGRAPIPLDAFAEPEILGALGDLEALLARARHEIAVPRTVADWAEWLRGLLERAIDARDANADGQTAIRRMLQQLVDAAREAGFERLIPFEAMRERVRQTLSASPAPQAFLSGGVTFCELVPLRAIPFRVVVIVGLGDEAFPRAGASPGFDLTATWPRAGDRSPRDDDRYLFLEALLSARDRVILTVPARDVRDGSTRPPSIVVAELLDALDARFTPEASSGGAGGTRLRERLVVSHPLVAHSPRYFRPDRAPGLVPRDAEAFLGAQALEAAHAEEGGGRLRRFLPDAGLPVDSPDDASEADATLELDTLIARIVAATRTFAQDRLGLSLPRLEEARADLDPVRLDALEHYALGEALLVQRLERVTPEDAAARLEARPALPSGLPGRLAARSVEQDVETLAAVARARSDGGERPDASVDLRLELGAGRIVRLVGRLDRLRDAGRLEVGFRRLGGSAEPSAWIRHLVLCACVEGGLDVTPRSVLVGRPAKNKEHDRVVVFEPVEDPLARLAELADWALGGEVRPLPFFPRASRKFAEKANDGKFEQAWRDAHNALLGGEDGGFSMPEFDRALEYPLIWDGSAPLAPAGSGESQARFDAVAEAFFRPLFEARRVLAE